MEDQRLSEQLRDLLLKELDHRVKNLFSIIGGMVSLGARSALTANDLAGTIRGRISALARAHALIRISKPGSGASREATLEELVRAVVEPYTDAATTPVGSRMIIHGPQIILGSESITAMALVLHELATNAAKYGAFSTPAGHVKISWAIKENELILSWQEREGPPVLGPPAKEGFGSLLARHSVEGQLHGDLAFIWDAAGLTANFSATVERLAL